MYKLEIYLIKGRRILRNKLHLGVVLRTYEAKSPENIQHPNRVKEKITKERNRNKRGVLGRLIHGRRGIRIRRTRWN